MSDHRGRQERLASTIKWALGETKNIGKLAKLSGVGRSTLYEWASGLVPIPGHAVEVIFHGLVAMRRQRLAAQFVTEALRLRAASFVVAPYLEPRTLDDVLSASIDATAEAAAAADEIRRAVADGVITDAELVRATQRHEAAKQKLEASERALEAAHKKPRIRVAAVGQ
jgi:hypothetical protein